MAQQDVVRTTQTTPVFPFVYDVVTRNDPCDYHPKAVSIKAILIGKYWVYICHSCCESLAEQLLIVPDYTEAQWRQERESE